MTIDKNMPAFNLPIYGRKLTKIYVSIHFLQLWYQWLVVFNPQLLHEAAESASNCDTPEIDGELNAYARTMNVGSESYDSLPYCIMAEIP